MKQYTTYITTAAAILFTIAGCDNTDYTNKAPFDNAAYINVAESKETESVLFKRTITKQEKELAATLAYPAGQDIEVHFKADPTLAAVYNARHNTKYETLSDEHYELSASSVVIPTGKTLSTPIIVYFKGLDLLEIDATYLLPVTIANASGGISILDGSKTIYYLVKRSSAITTAANLEHAYVEVSNFYMPNGGTPNPSAACVNDMKAVTYEAIIRVNNFDADTEISSIMGVEQYMCMRLGDANFQRQQLQLEGPGGKFPGSNKSKLLNPGEWYHIALTYDIAAKTMIFYVNGKEQSRITEYGGSSITSVSLGNKQLPKADGTGGDFLFYIGRSYGERNDISRQLNGEICECRIWNVARTAQQIWDNMYNIENPESEDNLAAYWKFNEGSGVDIIDHSKYGNNAKIVPYWQDAAGANPYELKDSSIWPSGIEIPQVNKEN